jgi:hypothetical protein
MCKCYLKKIVHLLNHKFIFKTPYGYYKKSARKQLHILNKNMIPPKEGMYNTL